VIADEIPDGAAVLDLGCGDGELLRRLVDRKHVRAQGVELDAAAVGRCIARDVPVVQIDLDGGIKGFGENSFDYVILEETLQTLRHPQEVLTGMLRVARHAIVSFPNFGFWRVRLDLSLRGRMPVTGRLPFRWYNTPNIHLLTLQDFLDWTASAGIRVTRGYALSRDGVQPLKDDDNLFAEEVLLVLGR
jgi:methionine biosynthesis protein MetW